MKRILNFACVFVSVSFLFVGCEKVGLYDDIQPHFVSDNLFPDIRLHVGDVYGFSYTITYGSDMYNVNDVDVKQKSTSHGLTIDDSFIVDFGVGVSGVVEESSSSGGNLNYELSQSGRLVASHVGETVLRITSLVLDTSFRVIVMGNYHTYTEPGLDFDDTQDSVCSKLTMRFHEYSTIADNCYQLCDDRNCYNLYVNYTDGVVDNYIVELSSTVPADELLAFLSERYQQIGDVFMRPNTLIVIPDIDSNTISYKKPQTYQ